MANLFNVKFCVSAASSDAGKIVISITHDEDVTTGVEVSVDGPLGSIKAYPGSGTPDFTGQTGTVKVNIPTDIDGNYVEGNYTFGVRLNPPVNPVETFTSDAFAFLQLTQELALNVKVYADCYVLQLIVEDDTVYPGGFTPTRSFVVDSPVIADEDDIADQTVTDEVNAISLTRSSGTAYENVPYTVRANATILSSTVSGDNDEFDIGVEYIYPQQTVNYTVMCNKDACGVISCVDKTVREITESACAYGGVARLPAYTADKLSSIQSSLTMYQYAVSCKDAKKINYWYNELKEIVGDCGCKEATDPVAIADSNIIYLRGQSAYELWLTDGNTGTIDDFFAALNPIGEWSEIDTSLFGFNFTQPSSNSTRLRYRILNDSIEFVGTLQHTISATNPLPNPVEVLSQNFDPGVSVDPLARIPFWSGPNVVGWFYKDSTSKKWLLQYNPDYSTYFILGKALSGRLATSKNYIATQEFTDWVTIPSGEYLNSHEPDAGDPLQWRSDGVFVYFKGEFDAAAFVPATGLLMIDSSYFDGFGISLVEGQVVPLIEAADNGLGAKMIGYLRIVGGGLKVFIDNTGQSGLVTDNQIGIGGILRIG